MNRELIVITSVKLNIYVIRENGENVELKIENKDEVQNAGSIYKGKITKLAPSMNAVFVDIGEEKEAFLPVKNIKDYKTGTNVLVQVKRSAIGTKGAKLSEKITIPGKYLVLTPTVSNVNISTKYKDIEQKNMLRERVKDVLSYFNEENYGYIIRTLACEASDEQLIEDFLNLKSIWENIQQNFKKKKAPAQLYTEEYKLYTILKDYAGNFEKIVVDDLDFYKIIKSYLKNFFPRKKIKLQLYNGKSILEDYEISKTISKILNPYIWLKSGGYLVLQETEALVVIDVNSGSSCKQKNLEDTAFSINLESCKEIAKHLRLRDLGGIIIIDFIDMQDEEKKEKLIEELQKEFSNDKRPVKIRGFTSLGLLELTRKRLEYSLIKQLSQNCYICNGKGYVKSSYLTLFEIEEKIKSMKPFAKLSVKINPLLESRLKDVLKSLGLNKSVKIVIDRNLSPEKFIVEREI